MVRDHAHHAMFEVAASHVQELKEFGVGHLLYMRFLKWMALCFCFLTLFIGVPQIIVNALGR